jgi:hypothetical protein
MGTARVRHPRGHPPSFSRPPMSIALETTSFQAVPASVQSAEITFGVARPHHKQGNSLTSSRENGISAPGRYIFPSLELRPGGPPNDGDDFVQAHDDRDVFQASPEVLPVIGIDGLPPPPDASHQCRRERGLTDGKISASQVAPLPPTHHADSALTLSGTLVQKTGRSQVMQTMTIST